MIVPFPQERWALVHETAKEWVCRMTTLVECWNKLEGNVGELSSWVTAKDALEDGGTNIPIEKLEGQLNQLKVKPTTLSGHYKYCICAMNR